jgi:membrane protein GlpM
MQGDESWVRDYRAGDLAWPVYCCERITHITLSLAMIALILKCLLGAVAVLLIALLSKSKSFFVAGLVPLFPTFALIAHFIVGTERSVQDLRTTALFGLWSLVPYAIYLLAVYWLSVRCTLALTLVSATVAWTAAAVVLLLAWSKVYPWVP